MRKQLTKIRIPRSLKRLVRIPAGKALYKLALKCRSRAIGRRATDPKFEDTHETYQNTWNLLAKKLSTQGWHPNQT